MGLTAGSSHRKLRVLLGERLMQTGNQIARQEWAVRRRAQYKFYVRPARRSPVQCRENAGEWAGKIRNAVRDHGQSERREARRIAIGVEDQPVALRREPRDHAL